MAPASAPMDFHSQIIENCRFISRKGDKFTIITAREPLGGIKVIALKIHGRKREAFLSGTGDSFRQALDDLHSKSADATQNYISLNGFEFAPVPKKRDSHDSDSESVRSDSTSSTVTVSGSDSSGYESLSDDETVSIASGHSTRKSKRKSRRGRGRKGEAGRKTARARQSRSPSRSRSRSRSLSRVISVTIDSDDETPKRPFHPRPQGDPSNPVRLIPRGSCRPPQGPSWFNPPPPLPRPVSMQRPPTLPPPPPPAGGAPGIRQQPMYIPPPPPPMPMPAPLYNARLHIKWPKHGEKLVLIMTPASLRAIELAAMNFVRRNPHSFTGVTTSDSAPSRLNLLRATVRRATVDGEDYDMTAYSGDDLRTLVEHASQSSIPRFDVDLGVPPPPPIPAVGLVGGSV